MKNSFLHIFLAGLLILWPGFALAATYTAEVDTGKTSVNALEVSLSLPPGTAVTDLATGHSAVLIWLEPPRYDAASHALTLAGLTPNGFVGRVPLFTFTSSLSMTELAGADSQVVAYKNDGLGTPVKARLMFVLGTTTTDTDPPVPFTPVVGSSPDIGGGAPFVSFLTEDKDSGIDHYEYATTYLLAPDESDWRPAVSPLILTRGEQGRIIYIKAVDRAGNARVAHIVGPIYRLRLLELAILIVTLCALYYGKRRWLPLFSR